MRDSNIALNYLTAERLLFLLAQLPKNTKIGFGQTDNLLLWDGDTNEYLGYINFFMDGSFEYK